MKEWVKKLWLIPLAGGALYGGLYFILPGKDKVVPVEFSEARIAGAKLAEEIVATSAFSIESLKKIAEYDRVGDVAQALVLISGEVIKNQEIRDRAIRLSSELEKMAVMIPRIEPDRARIIATEALSAEVALVSRLIVYNDHFFELFNFLREKLQGSATLTNGKLKELIKKINDEASAINGLNVKFTNGLAEFDKIYTE